MAMNKKEQAFVESLQLMIALRFTCPVEPDIDIPKVGGLVSGFTFNSHSKRVTESCSSIHSHSTCNDETRSKGPIRQYSTKLLAYKAMRYEVEVRCAKQLLFIDSVILQLELDNGR